MAHIDNGSVWSIYQINYTIHTNNTYFSQVIHSGFLLLLSWWSIPCCVLQLFRTLGCCESSEYLVATFRHYEKCQCLQSHVFFFFFFHLKCSHCKPAESKALRALVCGSVDLYVCMPMYLDDMDWHMCCSGWELSLCCLFCGYFFDLPLLFCKWSTIVATT